MPLESQNLYDCHKFNSNAMGIRYVNQIIINSLIILWAKCTIDQFLTFFALIKYKLKGLQSYHKIRLKSASGLNFMYTKGIGLKP